MKELPALARVFAYLSLLTVGGGMAAFPEMKILTVEVHHWLTFPQLVHLYSVGQMAPGPNMMMIVPIGEWAAGLLGAIVAVIAFFGPTGLLTFLVGRLWNKLSNWPWRKSIQEGLAPRVDRPAARRLLYVCARRRDRLRYGRNRGRNAADSAALQDQPRAARARRRNHRRFRLLGSLKGAGRASCSSHRVCLRKIDHFYAPLACQIRHGDKSMKRRLLVQSAGIGLPIFLPVSDVTKNPAVLSPWTRAGSCISATNWVVIFDRNTVDFGI
jgi:Chromate transporter